MSKKTKSASEPTLSSGAAAARTRKHAPAKRTTSNSVVESSQLIDSDSNTDLAAMAAAIAPSNSAVIEEPSFEEVARLAYSYWEARGYTGGSSEEDWLRAEQEIRGNLVGSAHA